MLFLVQMVEPLEAPFLQNDGWELFWERDDIFEIQQQL